MNMPIETIVAQATAPFVGAVGIVRVSGPRAAEIAQGLLGKLPTPRVASYVQIKDKAQQVIDTGIALFFAAPNSFTGEDVLELQCHGGLVIMDMVVKTCVQLGAKLAQPGEYSQRAFLNGKIDLCQAEAIADLISASTEQAVHCAQRSLSGVFSRRIEVIQDALTRLRIYIEAAIDFAEEEIDFLSEGIVQADIEQLLSLMRTLLSDAQKGCLLQEGSKVVIAGKPNVGKSSLFNLLAQNESAIVTDIPGTTRDIIKETIQIHGVPIFLMDTAGIREQTSDVVEAEGIKRTKAQLEKADRILLVVDATSEMIISQLEKEILKEYSEKVVLIVNKSDKLKTQPIVNYPHILFSVKQQSGVDALYQALTQHQQSFEGVFTARRRHIEAIQSALKHVESAHAQLIKTKAGELMAEELKYAQEFLGEVTGKITPDDLLGKIFSTFCIGK